MLILLPSLSRYFATKRSYPSLPASKSQVSRKAASEAMAMVAIKVGDMGVFEVYDCFTLAALSSLKALGWPGT